MADVPGAARAARALFVLPNPWDVGTAVLLAKLGFEALATTSAGYAFSIGKRDNAVGREVMLAHAGGDRRGDRAAGERRSRERLRRRPGDGRRDRCGLAGATGIVGGSIEDATGRPDAPIYPLDARRRAGAGGGRGGARRCRCRSCSRRAPRTSSSAVQISATRSRRLQAYQDAGADVLVRAGPRRPPPTSRTRRPLGRSAGQRARRVGRSRASTWPRARRARA